MQEGNPLQLDWQATSKSGAVAAGGAEAVAVGLGILERDGNAADAAAARQRLLDQQARLLRQSRRAAWLASLLRGSRRGGGGGLAVGGSGLI